MFSLWKTQSTELYRKSTGWFLYNRRNKVVSGIMLYRSLYQQYCLKGTSIKMTTREITLMFLLSDPSDKKSDDDVSSKRKSSVFCFTLKQINQKIWICFFMNIFTRNTDMEELAQIFELLRRFFIFYFLKYMLWFKRDHEVSVLRLTTLHGKLLPNFIHYFKKQ